MEQNHFDEQIKAAMQKLEPPYNANHWQRMEDALDAMDKGATASVEDAAFDAFISGKLENLSSDIKSPDWNRMEAALEKAGVSDKAFDIEVKSKIASIRPTYQSSHWELLAERLRREKAVKESLFKNKIAEVTILLLLLLNFYQYIPDYNAIQSLPITPENNIEEKVTPIDKQEIKIPTQQETIIPVAQVAPRKENKRQSTISTLFENATPIDNRLFISPTLSSVSIDGISSQPSLQQVTFGIDGKTGLTITVPEMTRHLGYLGISNSAFIETLPSLEPASLATATIPLGCKNCKKAKIPARFRFGMISHVGGTSAIRSSSVSQLLSTFALAQKGTSYGSGFTLGFKYGVSEIETGFIYSAKSYAPNINDAYESGGGINIKQFKGIDLQTIHIPLKLRVNYAVLGKGKWHLYFQTGVAMNVILRAQYDIIDKSQSNNKLFNDIAASSRLAKITLNRGIFGGDTFKENRFFTLNGGIGTEYYLSPKWSVFVEPEFNHYFSQSRIGPTQDRINSVSVSFGVKASFH